MGLHKYVLLFVLIVSVLLCGASCDAPDASITSDSSDISTVEDDGVLFKRSTFLVEDLDKALSIYRDILAFEVSSIKESGADSYSYPVFRIPSTAKLRFAVLDAPSQERTLAITEVKGVDLPRPADNIPIMSTVVIRVDDLPSVIEKIVALGLETTQLKKAKSPRGDFVEQAFIDFDGHLVVLYEMMT